MPLTSTKATTPPRGLLPPTPPNHCSLPIPPLTQTCPSPPRHQVSLISMTHTTLGTPVLCSTRLVSQPGLFLAFMWRPRCPPSLPQAPRTTTTPLTSIRHRDAPLPPCSPTLTQAPRALVPLLQLRLRLRTRPSLPTPRISATSPHRPSRPLMWRVNRLRSIPR